jgi:hypothetical protein
MGPHRFDRRVLLCGVKVCLTIKWIILFVVVSTGFVQPLNLDFPLYRATQRRPSMIGKLTGILSDKNPPEVIVDCHGVGYEVNVPMSTFYNLPATGEKVSLVTHFVVREDAQILYGFATLSEREAFRQLIKISGVGPRTALSVLSRVAW